MCRGFCPLKCKIKGHRLANTMIEDPRRAMLSA
jgi:hypothetical protein